MTDSNLAERGRLLSRVPVFSHFADEQIAALAGRLVTRSCENGETIFLRGDHGSSLAIIAAGSVALRLTSTQGREVTLAILEAGEFFGEMSLLDGKARSTDAVAFGDCELLILNRRDLLPVLRASSAASIEMVKVLSERLRRTSEQVEALALYPLSARLARLLLTIGRMDQSRSSTCGIVLPASFSQRDLGQLIGASREKVNLQLRRWTTRNVLGRSGGCLTIRNPDLLAEIAEAGAD